MADEIALSFEETNKLRLSLGLKPLKVENEGGKKEQIVRPNQPGLSEKEQQIKVKLERYGVII